MPRAKRPLKVFLCHAHSDRDAVKALYDRLTKDGVDAWLDKEKLLPGQDWELEIRKAVREADVVVVCLSKQFNQAGFRQKEVRLALDTAMEQPEGEIFIIPARLEESDTLESLRKWHEVDLFEGDGYELLVRSLQLRGDKIGAVLQKKKGLVTTDMLPRTKNGKSVNENSSDHSFAEFLGALSWMAWIVAWGALLWIVIALFYFWGESIGIDESEYPIGVAACMAVGGFSISLVLRSDRYIISVRSFLLIVLGWEIGGAIGGTIGDFTRYSIAPVLNYIGAYTPTWLISGALGGTFMVLVIHKSDVPISWKTILWMTFALGLGFNASELVLYLIDYWGLAWGIGGAISGLFVGVILLRENLIVSNKSFAVLMIGWAIGGAFGGMYRDSPTLNLLGWGIIILAVSVVMVWSLRIVEYK